MVTETRVLPGDIPPDYPSAHSFALFVRERRRR